MTVFAGFDRIAIINLPARTDRRAEMIGELRRIGLDRDPRVEFVDAVAPADVTPFRARGEKGCFLSHLNIVREAASTGESVLILEDDADFTPSAATWQVSPDCDIAYGGYTQNGPGDLETGGIIGSHCMGFSARAARALVPFLEGLLNHESPPPIDGAYVWFRRQHPDFKTEFARPVVAIQRPSASDVSPPRFFDRIPLVRSAAAAARGVKRSLQRRRWS